MFERKNLKAKLVQMTNIIQELKIWAEAGKTESRESYVKLSKAGHDQEAAQFIGMNMAYGLLIRKLDLLLNSENENSGEKDGK